MVSRKALAEGYRSLLMIVNLPAANALPLTFNTSALTFQTRSQTKNARGNVTPSVILSHVDRR